MKRIFLYISLMLCFLGCNHKDLLWTELVDDLDGRITYLEQICSEMNTNITSLQAIVSVLQSNDYITGIVEIKKNGEVIGYTITFGKHDPITIYHGQDGKDGADGANGSSSAPVIGVAKDSDGVYYWTLNGEWLLDDNGNKLPVSGKDGADGKDGQDGTDGKDGEDGKDGQDGVDGKDGVTPQLKIEDGYWYISYDNGATWTQLGKATGEDGKDGQNGSNGTNGKDGKDGKDGDSMFQSVTQDENYVYFTLADGTVIKIGKGSGSNDQPNSEFIFTITYDPNGGEGVMEIDTFYYGYAKTIKSCSFSKEDYYFVEWNTNPNGSGASYLPTYKLTIDRNITLYAQWSNSPLQAVDLGLSVRWASMNVGATTPEEYGDYFAWGETTSKETYNWSTYKYCNGSYSTITKYNTLSSSGTVDNKIVLEAADDAAAVNWGGSWRMPTHAELTELQTECTWTWTGQNGVLGYKVTSKTNGNSIFLPAAGYREDSSLDYAGAYGFYWSSAVSVASYSRQAFDVAFYYNNVYSGSGDRSRGQSVRPVCPYPYNK